MSGLNDDIGDYEFRGDFTSPSAMLPADATTDNIILAETDGIGDTSEIVKELEDFDVEIVTMNNDVVEVTSMAEIYGTITNNTVIAQENVSLLETFADGKYKPIADKIYEEVAPIQGFTKQPSKINFHEVKKILQTDQENRVVACDKRVVDFIEQRFENYKKLLLLFTERVLPSLTGKLKEIQEKSIRHLQSTANNSRAFLLSQQGYEKDTNFRVIDLRTVITSSCGSIFSGYFPATYPKKQLFMMLDQAFSADPVKTFLKDKNNGQFDISVLVGIDGGPADSHRNIAATYLRSTENNSEYERVSFSYLSLLSYFASPDLVVYFEKVAFAFEEIYKSLVDEATKIANGSSESNGKQSYDISQLTRTLLLANTRLMNFYILAEQLGIVINLGNKLFDEFEEAEADWKRTEGK